MNAYSLIVIKIIIIKKKLEVNKSYTVNVTSAFTLKYTLKK